MSNQTSPPEYTVRIEPHRRAVRVHPDESVLAGARAAGLNLPHSCRSGHCGSCRARLLAGRIEYPNGSPLGLTPQEAATGCILLCQARPRSDLVVEARTVASVSEVEIKSLPCRIERLTALAPEVMQVLLRLPAVEPLRFLPGQYLDVLLEDGRRRSFSIASPPHDSALLELHVRRVSGGRFGERLFADLATGALLRIEAPLGQFVYRPGTTPLLLIAGGTGYAPMKSILRHVLEQGIERDVYLYWGCREARDVYDEADLLDRVRRFPRLHAVVVLSEAKQVRHAHQRLGWVHEAVLDEHADLGTFDIYAAGPPALIEAIRARFPAHGVNRERLVFESFDYAGP